MDAALMPNDPQRLYYKKRCRLLLFVGLATLIAATMIVPYFAPLLDGYKLFGFPIGFYLTAQGSIIICIGLVFWHVAKQNRADREFGIMEDY